MDGAVRRVKGGWTATGEPWHYDADRYARVAAVRSAEQDAMRRYQRTEVPRLRNPAISPGNTSGARPP